MIQAIQWLLLLNLAFAPWQGCLAIFGLRASLGWGAVGITNFGLMNLLGAGLQIGATACLFISNRLWQKMEWRHSFLLLPLFLVILRIDRIDRYTFVLLQGFTLLTCLLYLACWARRGWIELPLLAKLGRPVFLLSAGLALLLPLVILVEGIAPFERLVSPKIARYRAWYEFPSSVAFLALTACLMCLFSFRRSVKQTWFSSVIYAGLAFLFLAADYITTHRTSLLGLILASAVFAWMYRAEKIKSVLGGVIFVLLVLGMFFGTVGVKNDWVRSSQSNYFARMSPDFEENPEVISGDGFIVNSSGRMGLWDHITRATKGHRIWGQGTGSSARWMISSPFAPGFGSEPHSEVLRIFFDYGLLGLLICALALWGLWRDGVFYRRNVAIACAALVSFVALENPLIHPNWFLIPFFWLLILEALEKDNGAGFV